LFKEEVVKNVCDRIGIKEPSEITAKKITLTNLVPFIGKSIEGKEGWEVEIKDLSSVRADPQAGRIPHISSFLITFHPEKMQIVKVISPWPKNEHEIDPFPSIEEEEIQMENIGERFTSFPQDKHEITLMKSIKVIDVNYSGITAHTKQIIAYYAIHQTTQYEKRPVWIIQTRGIPPFKPTIPPGEKIEDAELVPENARNHLRHIIDAQSGDLLYSDTIPQPV